MGCGSNGGTTNSTLNQTTIPNEAPNTVALPAPQTLPTQSLTDETNQPDVSAAIGTATGKLNCDASAEQLQTQFIHLINQARAQPRQCGDASLDAAAPIRWNSQLAAAAQRHSLDMMNNNFFSHTGSDNSEVADRVDAANYEWQAVGENLAAGQTSLQEAINGWLSSPGHCRNIMNTGFKEVGLSCVENPSTEFGTYWTSVFGAQFD